MSIRVLIILSLGLMVAACAAVPTNTLTQDKRDSLRIASVDVSFAQDATIQWHDAQAGGPEEPAARLAFLKQKAVGGTRNRAERDVQAIGAIDGDDRDSAGIRDSSWPGIAVRRTASLRSPMSRPSTPCLLRCHEDVDARDLSRA